MKKKITTMFFFVDIILYNYLAYVLDGEIRNFKSCSKIGGLPSTDRSLGNYRFLIEFQINIFKWRSEYP